MESDVSIFGDDRQFLTSDSVSVYFRNTRSQVTCKIHAGQWLFYYRRLINCVLNYSSSYRQRICEVDSIVNKSWNILQRSIVIILNFILLRFWTIQQTNKLREYIVYIHVHINILYSNCKFASNFLKNIMLSGTVIHSISRT